jgi:hypothetical protein
MVRAAVPNGAPKGLAALRCVSPALSESATLTGSTPSTANVFTAQTAIVMPGASSPAERALRLEHPRGGCGETWAITRAVRRRCWSPSRPYSRASARLGRRAWTPARRRRHRLRQRPVWRSRALIGCVVLKETRRLRGRVAWGAMIANGLRSARTASPIGMPTVAGSPGRRSMLWNRQQRMQIG